MSAKKALSKAKILSRYRSAAKRKVLKELRQAPIGTFDIGARVTHEYLGACVIMSKDQTGKYIIQCEKEKKQYTVPSTMMVSPLPAVTKPAGGSDHIYRPTAIAPKPDKATAPQPKVDLSKFSPQQLQRALKLLGDRYEKEITAGQHKQAERTKEQQIYFKDYINGKVPVMAESNTKRRRNATARTQTGMNMKTAKKANTKVKSTALKEAARKKMSALRESNNDNYAYAQLCDIASKLTGAIAEDIDLTKMTTGALQKHYMAHMNDPNQTPVFAAHLKRIKREISNRHNTIHEEPQLADDDAIGPVSAADLKKEFYHAKRKNKLAEASLTLPELRSKQKQLQSIQMRTDLTDAQKTKLQRIKGQLYAQARESGLQDYIAEGMTLTDYRQRRRALQQIQMDPDTSLDPLLKRAVASRLAQLNAEANSSGLEIMEEDSAQLEVGSPVVITGDVQFSGSTGVIDQFGTGNKFIVVDLAEHGKHSFDASNVTAAPDYDADLDEDFPGVMNGIKRTLKGKPSAETLKRQHFDRGVDAKTQGDTETLNKEFARYLKVAALTHPKDKTV